MMPETLRIGLDIGSTTIKCVVLDEADKIIYSCYERHLSLIAQKTRELLTRLDNEVVHGAPVRLLDTSRDDGGRPWAYVAPRGAGKAGWVYREYIECE